MPLVSIKHNYYPMITQLHEIGRGIYCQPWGLWSQRPITTWSIIGLVVKMFVQDFNKFKNFHFYDVIQEKSCMIRFDMGCANFSEVINLWGSTHFYVGLSLRLIVECVLVLSCFDSYILDDHDMTLRL